jgi:hypothetical protein
MCQSINSHIYQQQLKSIYSFKNKKELKSIYEKVNSTQLAANDKYMYFVCVYILPPSQNVSKTWSTKVNVFGPNF